MKIIIVLALFIAQLYLVLQGVTVFDKLVNPFFVFIISISIPFYYLWIKITTRAHQSRKSNAPFIHKIIGALMGLTSVGIFLKAFQKLFLEFPDPANGSDVIPQLATLYTRFNHGIFPYYPLEQFHWHPYPVYMPLHWLPLGFSFAMNIDVRWTGLLLLAISCTIWGYFTWSSNKNIFIKTLLTFLPVWVLWGYLKWARLDIAISLETIVAAYYLLLATGLASRNILLVTVGIITCLLSRYTMVFWLPLFLILLWFNLPKHKNILVWLSIIFSIFLFYIIPFYLKDPSILSKGIAYHNYCFINEWNGFGHPSRSAAFDQGLNFSYFIRDIFQGEMQHRITMARIVQAALMVLTMVAGLMAYRRWKHRISHYDFSLVMLYLFLLLFFMTSPVTYKYYYIPFLFVSAVLCAKIILLSKKIKV